MSCCIPNVSVIIPTHNRADKLPRAVESVLNQTYEDFELIIVSDGSTDNTEEVVRAFNDARIRFLKHDTPRGASAARNTGIRASSARYIAFLDDDDEWLPHKLETQLPVIQASNEKLGLVYAWMDYCKDGEFLRRYAPKLSGNIFPEMLDKQAIGNSSTLLIKRSVVDRVGYFDEDLPRGNDGNFIRKVTKHFEVDYVPKVLVRIHVGHIDRISVDSVENLKHVVTALESRLEMFKDDYDIFSAQKAAVIGQLATACVKIGQFRKGLAYFNDMLRCNITLRKKVGLLYHAVGRFVLFKLQNAFSPRRIHDA